MLLANCGNHLAADSIYVLLLGVLSSHCMCPQEGGADERRTFVFDATNNAQHLQLIGRIESVSALDFDGARSFADHLPYALYGLLIEILFRGIVE